MLLLVLILSMAFHGSCVTPWWYTLGLQITWPRTSKERDVTQWGSLADRTLGSSFWSDRELSLHQRLTMILHNFEKVIHHKYKYIYIYIYIYLFKYLSIYNYIEGRTHLELVSHHCFPSTPKDFPCFTLAFYQRRAASQVQQAVEKAFKDWERHFAEKYVAIGRALRKRGG